MAGYRDRVIKIPFPDLSEDPEKDPVWVVIRNPKLFPPAELQSFGNNGAYERDGEGNVTVADPEAAQEAMRKMISRLVVAARVYDPTEPGEIDPDTGEATGEQPRLPLPPWPPEIAAKLPLEIINKITEVFSEAVNPQKPASPGTQKTSSSPPSPSSTEPGAEAQPQPS